MTNEPRLGEAEVSYSITVERITGHGTNLATLPAQLVET